LVQHASVYINHHQGTTACAISTGCSSLMMHQCTHSTTNTNEMTTIPTRQLQQYTPPTNNNYTQDNLKLATIHTRQIRIQHVQKVKTHK